MTAFRPLAALLAAALVACALPARALLLDDDEPPQGADVTFPDPPPPAPDFARLVPFTVDSPTRNQFGFDPASLVVVDKTAMRYTLVITSPSGVHNVTHEAFRCNTGERRMLAIGRTDGSWAPVSGDEWTSIKGPAANARPWYGTLFRAMCDSGIGHAKASDIVRLMKQSRQVEY